MPQEREQPMEHTRFNCRMAAIFSDIHSNYHAFRACYADAVGRGAEAFIFLGDYISDLADPRKTMDLVYEIQSQYPTACLRGNRERYMLDCKNGSASFCPGSKTGSLLYTYRQLQPRDFAFFESLKIYDVVELNGIPFEIAHGAKGDDRFLFDGTDDRTEEVLARMKCDYFLAGHSHKQFIRRCGEKTILNPGSIGVPRDYGYLTQYALLKFGGQRVHFELRQIPYDAKATIHRQFESGLVDCAPHWAVSVLYDVITGEGYTMELLNRIHAYTNGDEAAVHDEAIWHRIAEEMGMKFTEKEILSGMDFVLDNR